MTRLDRFLAMRVLFGIVGVVTVFFAIISLSESLDTWRFNHIAETRGQWIAILSVLASGARWSIKALPVTVLIGSIVALLNLQSHSELLVMKASGLSIWQIVRGPVIAVFLVSGAITLYGDAQVTTLNRFIAPAPQSAGATIGASKQIWLEQKTDQKHYLIQARSSATDGNGLDEVVVFLGPGFNLRRILARTAQLHDGLWVFVDARLFSATSTYQEVDSYVLETDSSAADLKLKLASTEDFTFFELAAALKNGITDPASRAAASTRYAKLLSMPILLVGTLLIAFAFTGGYRRTGLYSSTILYGIVLGFVVFVINEMADRAGSSGVLDPMLAAWGPAVVSTIIGLTVLLYKEDGRA